MLHQVYNYFQPNRWLDLLNLPHQVATATVSVALAVLAASPVVTYGRRITRQVYVIVSGAAQTITACFARKQPGVRDHHSPVSTQRVESAIRPVIQSQDFGSQDLLGVQSAQDLRQQQLIINDEKGTPGVNRPGKSSEDHELVQRRIQNVMTNVAPHAHTKRSYALFLKRIRTITLEALGERKTDTAAEIFKLHSQNKKTLMANFGRQLTVCIVGAGPIGLAAALTFYKLGFKVECIEKYSENGDNGFTRRPQPFSLVRQSYWFINALGITNEQLLKAFDYTVNQQDIRNGGSVEAAQFQKVTQPMMRFAKEKRLNPKAKEYVPNNLSLPIQTMQGLLYDVIDQVRKLDKEKDLDCVFGTECIGIESIEGRHTLHFKKGQTNFSRTPPDVIYNASGGRINSLLRLKDVRIADYYGMGAFFQPPEESEKSSLTPQSLSRAVRVFCSFKPEEPVYTGVELSKEEYEDVSRLPRVIDAVAQDVGLKPSNNFFRVAIELGHVQEAAVVNQADEKIPQLILCGGDSLLKPHFLTASGANFGLLGLIELNRLLNEWVNRKMNAQELAAQYNEMADLLQKQSYQMVVNLFARPLVAK